MIKYVFRADGNAKIGIGHMMRTLTVADAIKNIDRQESILVLCADEDSKKIASTRGYKAISLNSDYNNLLSEIDSWKKLDLSNCCIVVDSYFVTNEYLQAIGKYGKVFLFEDYQNGKFDVYGIINYSVFIDKKIYEKVYGQIDNFILGGEYVPIRKSFLKSKWELKDKVNNILISTGGSDILNISGEIYKALDEILPNINYHIIVGPFNPYVEMLKNMSMESSNLTIHCDVKDMAGLAEICDIAISAGGSTMYELTVMGIPTICFSFAQNQEAFCEKYGYNISDYAGAYDKEPESVLYNIKRLLSDKYVDKKYRRECSMREKKLIDGKGANRIAEALVHSLD